MTIDDFVQALAWNNQIPAYTIEEGAGTAYYVADRYVIINCGSAGDAVNDLLLQISLGQSDKIEPESYAWLSWY